MFVQCPKDFTISSFLEKFFPRENFAEDIEGGFQNKSQFFLIEEPIKT